MDDKWWCATIIICSSVIDEEDGRTLCDEQIYLLKADDLESATKKAAEIGKRQEHSYESIQGQTVYWRFVGLQNVNELSDQDIVDGSEIRSKLVRVADPRILLDG